MQKENQSQSQKRKKKSPNGGSSPIKVVQTPKERIEGEVEAELESEQFPVEEKPAISPELAEVNKVLIESAVKVIGKTAELLTKIPEMNFSDDEIEQLKNLWSPLLPTMSPVLAAVVGTTIIVTGKITIYMALKGKRRKEHEELSE